MHKPAIAKRISKYLCFYDMNAHHVMLRTIYCIGDTRQEVEENKSEGEESENEEGESMCIKLQIKVSYILVGCILKQLHINML